MVEEGYAVCVSLLFVIGTQAEIQMTHFQRLSSSKSATMSCSLPCIQSQSCYGYMVQGNEECEMIFSSDVCSVCLDNGSTPCYKKLVNDNTPDVATEVTTEVTTPSNQVMVTFSIILYIVRLIPKFSQDSTKHKYCL